MKQYFFLMCGFLFLANPLVGQRSSWSFEKYNQYTYKTFPKFAAAQQYINPQKPDLDLLAAAVFYATNAQRAKYNYPIFKPSKALNTCAQGHSDDMKKYNFFSHHSIVDGKHDLDERFGQVGLVYGWKGENIAIQFGIQYESGRSVYPPDNYKNYFRYQYRGAAIPHHTYWSYALAVLEGWMNSPGHRANILSENFTYLGCGNALYPDSSFYNILRIKSTQNFSSEDTK